MLQESFKGISKKFQRCFKRVLMIFQGRLMSVLGSFRSASNRSQGILKKFNCFKQFLICFNEVLGVLPDCLKTVSRRF